MFARAATLDEREDSFAFTSTLWTLFVLLFTALLRSECSECAVVISFPPW